LRLGFGKVSSDREAWALGPLPRLVRPEVSERFGPGRAVRAGVRGGIGRGRAIR